MSFETSLKTFVEIDDELKKVADEAKLLRKNKAALETSISTHMMRNDIEEQSCLDNSRVKIVTKKRLSSGFNKRGVHECATELFGQDNATLLVKMIEEKKSVEESTGLKRLGAKEK